MNTNACINDTNKKDIEKQRKNKHHLRNCQTKRLNKRREVLRREYQQPSDCKKYKNLFKLLHIYFTYYYY